MIPLLAAAALPIVQSLMQNGLTTLASAVAAKGKDFVEKELGVTLPDQPTEAEVLALRQVEFDNEEKLRAFAVRKAELALEGERVAQGEVTARWKADMLSDSWLSKNIRPMVLLLLLTTYFLFSVASGFGFHVTQAYVELLAQMLMLVMGAYFVGRTWEKVVDMRERGKQ